MAARTVSGPPELWRVLGHDLRWRLLALLSRSDQRVNELVDKVHEPQNLVSYHLGLLKRSSLVNERHSSADGRDVYYHLNLDRLGSELAAAATALHPSLRLNATPQPLERRLGQPRRVLFICTGNSARSLIAEAIVRERGGGTLEAFSAGPRPAGVNPFALEILHEMGIGTRGLRSKELGEVVGVHFDYVITLCDIAREECPPLAGSPEYLHWSLPDPAAVTGPIDKRRAAFRSTASELADRIGLFMQLGAPNEPTKKFRVGGKSR